MPEDVYGFNARDADNLLRLIGKTPNRFSNYDTSDATRLVIAYTAAGATGRSGATLGKGTAVMYYLADSGTDRVLTAASYTTPVDFYNLSTVGVASGVYLMLLRLGNDYVCNWEDCA
jgi:hypothetical protein